MQTHWRLAIMFNDASRDVFALEQALISAGAAIRAITVGNGLRLGVADRADDPGDGGARGKSAEVDGAIEITIANDRVADILRICTRLRPVVAALAEPGSIEVMTGPMFHMVPVRRGDCFLSLAFRRDPDTTSAQFQDWWYNQHSVVAIPVLGEGLLAYDQVHVEASASRAAADALGVPYVEYDAYDNLTWADLAAYHHSISDQGAMARVFADEVGRIDHSSNRHAMMREIGQSGPPTESED